jgi:hypothetical protein
MTAGRNYDGRRSFVGGDCPLGDQIQGRRVRNRNENTLREFQFQMWFNLCRCSQAIINLKDLVKAGQLKYQPWLILQGNQPEVLRFAAESFVADD